jgi:insertion element IS1 protein InsB
VNHSVLVTVHPAQVEVEIWRADELEVRRGLSSELDEMWSFVQAKAHPRWLWHAIDHHTGQVLAYVFGRRKDAVFLKLQQLLEPFGITKFYTDGWGAYERHIDARATSRGQGEHAENREQAHQSPDPHQAVSASYAVLFQDGTDARSGDWAVHQSV